MTKNHYYILDTSALLFDPSSLTYFKNNYVVIPAAVIEELDKHKERMDEVGSNARSVNRALYKLKDLGKLTIGVKDKDSSVTIILMDGDLEDIPASLDKSKADNRILGICFSIIKTKKIDNNKVHLITNDLNLGLKAQIYGIDSNEFKPEEKYQITDYIGYREIDDTDITSIDSIYANGKIIIPKKFNAIENEYFLIKNHISKQSVRCVHKDGFLHKINSDKQKCYNIKPLNNEQVYAMDLLLNPDIKIVSLTGLSGSGKTLISVAAGLAQCLEKSKNYDRLIISRSLVLLSGRDKLGFLKGSLREKLDPYMLPLKDAIDQVVGENSGAFEYLTATTFDNVQRSNKPKIEVEPLQYIRGRSLKNAFFIVDEAQNLTINEVKAITTRMGDNAKLILLGDTDQVDNPYLSRSTNGLSQVIEKFKGSKLAGHIYLKEGVRSQLSKEAAERL